jgi:hypothetical protein
LVANGVILYYGRSFGFPGINPRYPAIEWRTRIGDWTIYDERGPGNHVDFSSDWHVRKITRALAARAGKNGIRADENHTAILLANHTFMHFHAFNVYSRLAGSTLRVRSFRDDFPAESIAPRILNAAYVIEKTGDLGPEWSLGELRKATARIQEWELTGPKFFRILPLAGGLPVKDRYGAYELPDGSTVRIYENTLWSDREIDWAVSIPTDYRLEGGMEIRRISMKPYRLPHCRAVLLETVGSGKPADPEGLHLFLHLYGPQGGTPDSRDTTDLPLADGHFLVDKDPESSTRYRFLFFFYKSIPDEENYPGLGLFHPSTGYRLQCFTADGERVPEDMIRLMEPISFND